MNERLPVVLAFCPEGEHHQIGLMQFSLFLKKKGVEVIYLGPNTPFDGIVSLIRLKKVSILTISVTVGGNVEALNRWMLATSQAFPDPKFVLGGAAFGRSEDGNRLQHPNISYPWEVEWDAWLRKEFQIF